MTRLVTHALAPSLAVVMAAAWWLLMGDTVLLDVVPTRDDTFVTSPYALLILVGFAVALAMSRARPQWAVGLTTMLLSAQLLFWPARFRQLSWPAYLLLVPMVVFVSRSMSGEERRRFLGVGLVGAVAVTALLTVPYFSMKGTEGTLNGKAWSAQPGLGQDIAVWLVVCVAITLGAWRLGKKRATQAQLSSLDDVPTWSPLASDAGFEALTAREQEIFVSVAHGLSNAEVAEALYISEATVKTHVGNALTKLDLVSRGALIVYAYERGIIRPQYVEAIKTADGRQALMTD